MACGESYHFKSTYRLAKIETFVGPHRTGIGWGDVMLRTLSASWCGELGRYEYRVDGKVVKESDINDGIV